LSPLYRQRIFVFALSSHPLTEAKARFSLRVLARQDGPTVLGGDSFSGMIVTDAGMHPNVSAIVYVAARAPDAGEDYTALAKKYPTPPASTGIIFDGDEGRLSEEAFLRDFAGDLPEAKAKTLCAVQWPFHKALLTGKTRHAAWRSKPSWYAVSTEDRTINPDLERLPFISRAYPPRQLPYASRIWIVYECSSTCLITRYG
jgi:Alpha/beta hydrolase family